MGGCGDGDGQDNSDTTLLMQFKIAASRGNIAASRGNIAASRGNIAASRGNIAASRGNIAASGDNIAASRDNIAASGGNIAASGGGTHPLLLVRERVAPHAVLLGGVAAWRVAHLTVVGEWRNVRGMFGEFSRNDSFYWLVVW